MNKIFTKSKVSSMFMCFSKLPSLIQNNVYCHSGMNVPKGGIM